MAKELPYFRFTVSEWLTDDISLESYELKGLFIDICAFYWFKDCSITLAMLYKKFGNENLILELIDLGIIKHESKHDKIKIDFLMTQYDLLSEKRKLRQIAGSKGGNAKAMLKQKGSYKDKDKDNKNNKDKDKPFDFYQSLIDLGANKDLVDEWLKIRKKGKAINSEIAFKGFLREANLSGLPIDQILTKCCEKSWKGFESAWIDNGNNQFNKKEVKVASEPKKPVDI